ncbi:MAG TPA: N-acetylmuramic acid 6-phosphate etherase [Nitrospirae bacterium]|nr:N-acetylmuramic acid 6-phosphate etherase [Nitrospirota bacterium]
MSTEDLNPSAIEIDLLSVEEIIHIMNEENLAAVQAVNKAGDSISSAVKDAVITIKSGGRLVYVGAGTSGRLGVLDASEIPPTFGEAPGVIKAIMAGGDAALTTSIEGAEDNRPAGKHAVADITSRDMLLGISASGKTPFVLSALMEGKDQGARCWLLTCNDIEYDFFDGVIKVIVGPEIVAGSTRLKAGTATKMVLNMISTTAMVKLGKVYKGYMIDVVPSNRKLKDRAVRIIMDLTGCSREEAGTLLQSSGGSAKTAVLMYLKGLDYENAGRLLKESGGLLRKALL